MKGGTLSVLLAVFAVAFCDHHVEHHGHKDAPKPVQHAEHHVEHHDDHHDDDHHDHTGDFDSIDHRLDHLTTRLGKLLENIHHRTDPIRIAKAHGLETRIQRIEGDGCGKTEFQCGGDDPECIGDLFVCDGHKDCRNGADEAHCELPLHVGDIFDGHMISDTCTKRQPDVISFEIKTIRQRSFFTGYPGIKVNILIDHEAKSRGLHGSVALPTVGLYKFARQMLILQPPEADRLALVCQFDGYNMEKCIGHILHEASLIECAQLVFIKRH